MTDKVTQCKLLLQHFQAGKTMSALEADKAPFFITQFHARMFELREQGWVFRDWWETSSNGARYKRYALVGHSAELEVMA